MTLILTTNKKYPHNWTSFLETLPIKSSPRCKSNQANFFDLHSISSDYKNVQNKMLEAR